MMADLRFAGTLFDAGAAAPSSSALFDQDNDETNEVLQRLLNDLQNVSDDDATDAPAAPMAAFAVSGSGYPSETNAAGPFSAAAGGFVVEGSASLPNSTSLHAALPPPPPPPIYSGSPMIVPQSPFSLYAAAAPAAPAPPHSKPPPSFAEAMASTTPLSLPHPSPMAVSPASLPHYVPAPAQDAILVRSANGVFLLNPIAAKPTPPYTPHTAGNSPPISPLPRYALPPSATPNAFLGVSVAQAHTHTHRPPQYGGAGGGSPFLGTYTRSITSLRGTPTYGPAAPPPYASA